VSMVRGKLARLLLCAQLVPAALALDNNTTRTPNMGMLNWGVFRCETDCATHRDTCVSEENLKGQIDAMVRGGFVKAGYNYVNLECALPPCLPVAPAALRSAAVVPLAAAAVPLAAAALSRGTF
jgi:hypothetical protein